MRVAVIEDSMVVQRIYSASFEESGYRAEYFTSSQESIGRLAAGRFDLVVCPSYPTHQDGPDIARRLKLSPGFEKTSVIVSTSLERADVDCLWDAELFDAVLFKPFDRDGLLQILDGQKARITAAERDKPLAAVIDDSSTARLVLQREMEGLGFEVVTAGDGLEGLELIRETMPDIVLTDIEMPHMSGLELCNELSGDRSLSHIPIMVISSVASDAQVRNGFGSGVINFLKKPVTPTDLRTAADALLGVQKQASRGAALVVEDHLNTASVISRELAKVGVSSNLCRSAAELDAFLAVFRPDLITLDLILPDARGPEICRRLRSRPEMEAVTIIVVADEVDRAGMIECLNNRADDFLIKPFTQEEFRARIENHLRFKKLSDELNLRTRILESLAYHDGLTGLLNHRYLDEGFRREVEWALNENEPLAFLMIDLDNFKTVNDRYGHQVGDEVLKAVAAEIQRQVRDVGAACRYGGEEIGVLLPKAGSIRALEIAERIRSNAGKMRYTSRGIRQTLSVGVSVFPDISGADRLLADADQAMYQAKTRGRNRVVLFNPNE